MHDLDREVAELIEQAHAEARESVRAKLRAQHEELLLDRARALLDPPAPAPSGTALWAYCIVAAGRVVPDGIEGIDGPPALVTAGGLAAVVSEVPLAEFGEEPLRENLNDLAWLERVARAHDHVLGELFADGPLVPLRVCTIYADEARVEEMLRERAADLTATLDRLDGKAEWGVKAVADRAVLEEAARESTPAPEASGEGGAYIARKRQATIARERAEALIADTLEEAHARLGEWADASVVLPAQNRELSGHRGEMVLNAAYLVDERRAESFRGVVGELELPGLDFELTGPWPAYHFAESPR